MADACIKEMVVKNGIWRVVFLGGEGGGGDGGGGSLYFHSV
jgi:hypothetical protein